MTEKLKLGSKIKTPGRTLTEADIVIFAGLTGDYHPAHTNEIYASKNDIIKRRIAHGLLTLSICQGLLLRSNIIDWEEEPILMLGLNNVKFISPVYPNDTLYSIFEVIDVRDSKSVKGGKIVTMRCECRKANDLIVLSYEYSFIYMGNNQFTKSST